MDTKKWYQSKAVLTAIVAGVLGVLSAIGIAIPEFVYTILAAFGLYALRVGEKPIK